MAGMLPVCCGALLAGWKHVSGLFFQLISCYMKANFSLQRTAMFLSRMKHGTKTQKNGVGVVFPLSRINFLQCHDGRQIVKQGGVRAAAERTLK